MRFVSKVLQCDHYLGKSIQISFHWSELSHAAGTGLCSNLCRDYLPKEAAGGKQHGRVIWAVLHGEVANGKSKYNSVLQTA